MSTKLATPQPRARGRAGQGAPRIRQAISSGGVRFWEAADFPDIDARVTDRALSRLKDAGELVSVRRGLYYRGKKWSWGMSRPSNQDAALRIADTQGVGPAGLSAANELGFTTQMPATDIFAVPGPVPRPLPTAKFVGRPSRTARARARLTPLEVATLEVLDAWTNVIEVSVVDVVSDLAKWLVDGTLHAQRMTKGAVDEPPAARERLRFVLEASDHHDLVNQVPGAVDAATRTKALTGLAGAL